MSLISSEEGKRNLTVGLLESVVNGVGVVNFDQILISQYTSYSAENINHFFLYFQYANNKDYSTLFKTGTCTEQGMI